MVTMEDSVGTNIAKVNLAFSQDKKNSALTVRARLKGMSCEATNVSHELRTEEL